MQNKMSPKLLFMLHFQTTKCVHEIKYMLKLNSFTNEHTHWFPGLVSGHGHVSHGTRGGSP